MARKKVEIPANIKEALEKGFFYHRPGDDTLYIDGMKIAETMVGELVLAIGSGAVLKSFMFGWASALIDLGAARAIYHQAIK
jgi:hypothetical protein